MNNTIYAKKSGDITIVVDLVYSPDDAGYYLEKCVIYPDKMDIFFSDTYKFEMDILRSFEKKQIKWEKR